MNIRKFPIIRWASPGTRRKYAWHAPPQAFRCSSGSVMVFAPLFTRPIFLNGHPCYQSRRTALLIVDRATVAAEVLVPFTPLLPTSRRIGSPMREARATSPQLLRAAAQPRLAGYWGLASREMQARASPVVAVRSAPCGGAKPARDA